MVSKISDWDSLCTHREIWYTEPIKSRGWDFQVQWVASYGFILPRRLRVPGSTGLPDPEPTVSAEDPDRPKLFPPVCWDFPVPGMCTTSVLSYDEKLMGMNILMAWDEPEMKVTSVCQYSSSSKTRFWCVLFCFVLFCFVLFCLWPRHP